MDWDFCQLIPGTQDGFPEMEVQLHWETGDRIHLPLKRLADPPHWTDHSDPAHWIEARKSCHRKGPTTAQQWNGHFATFHCFLIIYRLKITKSHHDPPSKAQARLQSITSSL